MSLSDEGDLFDDSVGSDDSDSEDDSPPADSPHTPESSLRLPLSASNASSPAPKKASLTPRAPISVSIHPDVSTIMRIHDSLSQLSEQTGVAVVPLSFTGSSLKLLPSTPSCVPSNLDEIEDTIRRLRQHLDAYTANFEKKRVFENSLRARHQNLYFRQRSLKFAMRHETSSASGGGGSSEDGKKKKKRGKKGFESLSLDSETAGDVKSVAADLRSSHHGKKRERERRPEPETKVAGGEDADAEGETHSERPSSQSTSSLARSSSGQSLDDSPTAPPSVSRSPSPTKIRRKKSLTMSGGDIRVLHRVKRLQARRAAVERQIELADEILKEYKTCANAVRACEVMLAQNEDRMPLLHQMKQRESRIRGMDLMKEEMSEMETSISNLHKAATLRSRTMTAFMASLARKKLQRRHKTTTTKKKKSVVRNLSEDLDASGSASGSRSGSGSRSASEVLWQRKNLKRDDDGNAGGVDGPAHPSTAQSTATDAGPGDLPEAAENPTNGSDHDPSAVDSRFNESPEGVRQDSDPDPEDSSSAQIELKKLRGTVEELQTENALLKKRINLLLFGVVGIGLFFVLALLRIVI